MPTPPRSIDSLMRRHFIAVEPGDDVDDVLQLMAFARVRFLPVVERGVLLGLVGYRALALAKLEDLRAGRGAGTQRIADLMEPPESTVLARTGLDTAAHRLSGSEHGCLPVVEPSAAGLRIVGLVTEQDLLKAIFRPSPTSGVAA